MTPKFVRENYKLVRDGMERRGGDVGIVDRFLWLDYVAGEIQRSLEEIRAERHIIEKRIAAKKIKEREDEKEKNK